MSPRAKLVAVIAALAAVAILAAAACGGGNDNDTQTKDQLQQLEQKINDLQSSLNNLHDAAMRQQVLLAYTSLRAEGLHGIAESVNTASEIDPAWHGAVSRMHLIVMATDWPEDLKAKADDCATKLEKFAKALESGDLAASKKTAPEAHLAWHELDGAAANFLGAAPEEEMSH